MAEFLSRGVAFLTRCSPGVWLSSLQGDKSLPAHRLLCLHNGGGGVERAAAAAACEPRLRHQHTSVASSASWSRVASTESSSSSSSSPSLVTASRGGVVAVRRRLLGANSPDLNRGRSCYSTSCYSTRSGHGVCFSGKTKENEQVDGQEAAVEGEGPRLPDLPVFPTGAMVVSVVASNYLAQFPLSDWLTVGSLTYPVAFLVTDVTNRLYGADRARQVVYFGFGAGVSASLLLSPVRIAAASGTSFLLSQLLDVYIFSKLRDKEWWKAPLVSTSISSCVDSYLFTFLAFYGDASMPHWATLATGDYAIKIAVALASLLPFRALVQRSRKGKV
mmetsp:Transcript_13065/g.36662  ORF Transcript_13065/g.36662 Transcript_13065/m.36662 type:complete len:332 (-) Transcript_13065:1849-2844(-)